jgi:hypothetical protein
VPLLLTLTLLAGLLGAATAGPAATVTTAATAATVSSRATADRLPLGPRNLRETRSTRTLQQGVTLTTIVRGSADSRDVWTVEVAVPGGSGSPDPDAPPTALSDQAHAQALADRLRAQGFESRVEQVTTPAVTDFAGGPLGFRVRIGQFTDRVASDAVLARVRAAGFTASSVFTGWDGRADDRGPWRAWVLTVDPKRFNGRLVASYGPDIEQRETTSKLALLAGATAAINAGYFVLDPKSGAPGDPAGVGVYRGRLLSETTNGRPAFALSTTGHSDVVRLRWAGAALAGSRRLRLDGLNRVPGLIRNCGGTPDDQPTARPRHDFTCTDADEAVLFTTAYGVATPAGDGVEVLLDSKGRVQSIRSPRGGQLPAGGSSIQATGVLAERLRALTSPGAKLTIRSRLTDLRGHPVRTNRRTAIVNGGPGLVRDGRLTITANRDGFVRDGDPSFYYGFSAKRNPRTFGGQDARGRTVLVAVDGRSTTSLGLTIRETGLVARALGLRQAMNLDGGGSTTVVARGAVLNTPSDATGERPVGDALLVLRRR